MSPGSLMVASLGMCTGMHVRNYLDKNNIEHSGIEISVKNKYERNPTRVGEFTLTVSIDGELTEEQKRQLAVAFLSQLQRQDLHKEFKEYSRLFKAIGIDPYRNEIEEHASSEKQFIQRAARRLLA